MLESEEMGVAGFPLIWYWLLSRGKRTQQILVPSLSWMVMLPSLALCRKIVVRRGRRAQVDDGRGDVRAGGVDGIRQCA